MSRTWWNGVLTAQSSKYWQKLCPILRKIVGWWRKTDFRFVISRIELGKDRVRRSCIFFKPQICNTVISEALSVLEWWGDARCVQDECCKLSISLLAFTSHSVPYCSLYPGKFALHLTVVFVGIYFLAMDSVFFFCRCDAVWTSLRTDKLKDYCIS